MTGAGLSKNLDGGDFVMNIIVVNLIEKLALNSTDWEDRFLQLTPVEVKLCYIFYGVSSAEYFFQQTWSQGSKYWPMLM